MNFSVNFCCKLFDTLFCKIYTFRDIQVFQSFWDILYIYIYIYIMCPLAYFMYSYVCLYRMSQTTPFISETEHFRKKRSDKSYRILNDLFYDLISLTLGRL